MEIRRKIVRLVFGLSLCLIFVSVALSWELLRVKFARVDTHELETSSALFDKVLQETQDSIAAKARTLGFWENSADFVRTRNPAFLVANSSDLDQLMQGIKTNILAFTDARGRILWIAGYDPDQEREVPIPGEVLTFFRNPAQPFYRHRQPYDDFKGIHAFRTGTLLFASSGIFAKKNPRQSQGSVLVGKFLNEEALSKASHQVGAKISLHTLGGASENDPDFDSARSHLLGSASARAWIGKDHSDQISIYQLIHDHRGQPLLIAKLDRTRHIATLKHSLLLILFTSAMVVALIFGAAAWIALDRLLLRRIDNMNRFIRRLKTEKNLSLRLEDHGHDEISHQAALLNELLGTIQSHTQTIREQERQVLMSSRLASLGVLSAGVAHEINNPLTAIGINVANMKRIVERRTKEGQADPTLITLLEKQRTAAKRIASIVQSLKIYAHPDQEHEELIDLHLLVDDTLGLCGNLFLEHGITISKQLHAERPLIVGNPGKIQQVLLNLLSNAKDALNHRERDREIRIESRDRDGRILLSVRDNGCGIAEDRVAHIFDAFYTTKPPGSGMGLGLSISHSIITTAGGRISVESQEGLGSAFTIALPEAAQAPGLALSTSPTRYSDPVTRIKSPDSAC